MNPWQLAQQIQHVLKAAAWPGGSQEPVFGEQKVAVYSGPPDAATLPAGFPFALVIIGDYTPDPDEPGLIEQTFEIGVANQVEGDSLGSRAVLGGPIADLGSSMGRGSAELKAQALAAIEDLTGADGAAIVVSSQGGSGPQQLDKRHLVFESCRLTAVCTTAPHYTAPQELRIRGNVIRWNGSQCSPRFDFLQYRVGFVAGSTPAATPDDLDTVEFTGTAIEAPISPAPGRTYSVFADYDPRGSGSAAASSSALVGSWVTT